MAIKLVHERSGTTLCVDPGEKAINQEFAMRIVLKNVDEMLQDARESSGKAWTRDGIQR